MSGPLKDYRILHTLGRGARSRIIAAVDLRSGRHVAIKHVVRRGPDDDPFLQQVEMEYQVTHGLDHPYLRHSHQLIRVRNWLRVAELYLVMDFIEGLTLEEARPNRLTTFLTLFRKVAQGLGALHQFGFVHTDIKPINIMLAARGVVKVIDFGQSCRLGYKKDRIQGTPDYIAPEQVRRLPLDERTDVFNLGASMYWVLTSQNYPTAIRSEGPKGREVIQPRVAVAPVELNDKIPISLSALIMECCRDNPMERPATMQQVDARLKAVQDLWRKRHEDRMRS